MLYGTTALVPLYLQTLMGYPALQSGMAVSPRGIGSFISTLIVGRIITRFDTRWLLLLGFGVLAYATSMFAQINLQISPASIGWPNVISGLAFGFIFVPLTTTTMGTLPNEQIRNATGIYNLMRNIGGSIGIAAVTSAVSRGAQKNALTFAPHFTAMSHTFQQRLSEAYSALAPQVGPAQAAARAYALVYQVVTQQAQLTAYVHTFQTLSVLCLICLPGILLFRHVRAQRGAVAAD